MENICVNVQKYEGGFLVEVQDDNTCRRFVSTSLSKVMKEVRTALAGSVPEDTQATTE